MTTELTSRVEGYLRGKVGDGALTVVSAEHMAGTGLSRTVMPVKARLGDGTPHDFIFLLHEAASPVPPNRSAEFAAMRILSGEPRLKVPRAWGTEESSDLLGAPFVVTDMLPGTSHPKQLMAPAYGTSARAIAHESFAILGHLTTFDAQGTDLGPAVETPSVSEVHEATIDRHEAILRETGAAGRPVLAAALRYLRRRLPRPPERIAIVHGDYRIGNYLFDTDGITGVIDWEMVHKGDPLEDLGWALLPNWEFGTHPGLAAGFLTREEAVTAWESASGLRVDPAALDWWIVLAHVKAAGIWATSGHMFRSGGSREPIVALVGHAIPQQEVHLVEMLRKADA